MCTASRSNHGCKEGPLSVRDTLSLGICLFHSLRELHTRRILHRNIKPGNVIIDSRDSPLRATLIDIGLAHTVLANCCPTSCAGSRAVHFSGTGGGDGRRCGRAVGPVFRRHPAVRMPVGTHALLRRYGREIVVRAHDGARPAAGFHEVDVPRVLEEVIQRLLRKDPRDRYQSADGALADLQAILAGIDRGERDPHLVVGFSDLRSSLTEPALVGRQRELERIDHCIERVRAGRSSLILLEGESGSGKTRLLVEMARRGVATGHVGAARHSVE